MKKTLNINLGGLAFIIDENAFELLHTYLEALKRKFNNATEREEILNDIESRIAELLNQKLADRKEVVGIDDVQSVMDAMGKPEDIAGEDAAEASAAESTAQTVAAGDNQSGTQTVHKKLFRDPDDAKVGGVISGLCHYFGISDPTWMRIAAIILIFFGGAIIPLYILLLVVVPKATTAAEKLQMKGEPININTIEKEIRDAATKATESVHKLVNDRNFFEKLWEICLAVLRTFGKMFGAFMVLVSMICLFAVSTCFLVFYSMNGSDFAAATRMLVDSHATLVIFSLGFLLFFAPPLIGLIYLGLRLMLGERSRVKWLKSVLLVCWLLGLVLLGTTAFKIGVNFKMQGSKSQSIALMQPANKGLYVQIADSSGKKAEADNDDENEDHSFNIDFDGVFVNGINLKDLPRIPVGTPDLQIVPSENDAFYIQETIISQGRTKADAEKNAEMVTYNFNQTDSIVNLSEYLILEKGGKYRAQHIKMKLAIPEGKTVHFANNIDNWDVTAKTSAAHDNKHFAHTIWTVEKGQLRCLNCKNQPKEKSGDEVDAHDKDGKTTEKNKDEDDKDDKDKTEDF